MKCQECGASVLPNIGGPPHERCAPCEVRFQTGRAEALLSELDAARAEIRRLTALWEPEVVAGLRERCSALEGALRGVCDAYEATLISDYQTRRNPTPSDPAITKARALLAPASPAPAMTEGLECNCEAYMAVGYCIHVHR